MAWLRERRLRLLPGHSMVLSNTTGPDGRGIIAYIKESPNCAEIIFNTDCKVFIRITVKCHGKQLIFG